MQVRAEGYSDIPRFGSRITVMQDFLTDEQVFLGDVRIGPDLANVGLRQPDSRWHYEHLYAPKSKVPQSTMPPFPNLFSVKKIHGNHSSDALTLTGDAAPPAGYEVVPTRQAQALVAYLRSLKADVGIFEAPLPQPKTNGVPTNAVPASANGPGSTNAAPGDTNASTNAAPAPQGGQDTSPK
jgi:cbb3-type cytochrome oxidase cytochrome c subunit